MISGKEYKHLLLARAMNRGPHDRYRIWIEINLNNVVDNQQCEMYSEDVDKDPLGTKAFLKAKGRLRK